MSSLQNIRVSVPRREMILLPRGPKRHALVELWLISRKAMQKWRRQRAAKSPPFSRVLSSGNMSSLLLYYAAAVSFVMYSKARVTFSLYIGQNAFYFLGHRLVGPFGSADIGGFWNHYKHCVLRYRCWLVEPSQVHSQPSKL